MLEIRFLIILQSNTFKFVTLHVGGIGLLRCVCPTPKINAVVHYNE